MHHQIGKRIKRERSRRKITRQALADAVGKSYQMIASIENGHTKISLDLLYAIAKALDIPVFVLTGYTCEQYESYRMMVDNLEDLLETIEKKDWQVDGEGIPADTKKALVMQIEAIIAQQKYEKQQKNCHRATTRE